MSLYGRGEEGMNQQLGRRRQVVSGDIGSFDLNDQSELSIYDHYYICSKTGTGTTSSFTVPNPFFLHIKQFKVIDVSIPFSWMNLPTATILEATVTRTDVPGVTSGSVTVPAANYSAASLIIALNALHVTLAKGVSFSMSGDKIAVTYTPPAAGTYRLDIVGGSAVANMLGVASSGFSVTVINPATTTTTLPNLPNFRPIQRLFITSHALTVFDTKIRTNLPLPNVLVDIPIKSTDAYGGVIHTKLNRAFQINNRFAQPLDFKIIDETGTEIPFQTNGGDVHLTLQYYRTGKLLQT